jgi:hypothetical protein
MFQRKHDLAFAAAAFDLDTAFDQTRQETAATTAQAVLIAHDRNGIGRR